MCNFTSIEANLRVHTNRMHSNKVYACDNCEYIAKEKRTLGHHIKINHKGKKIQCDICKSMFTRRENLSAHQKLFHNNITN